METPPKPSSQRPGAPVGFLSGLGVGALAARLFGPGRQNRTLEPGMNYGTMPNYGPYGATAYYDQFQSDRYGSSTSNAGTTSTSAGYGGTEIR
ncbi:hypothetical protein MPSI1_002633 [Malassezia psittaci]|uniref:Uncharacterized protein n=1 Tax=Malassezia psittaci TaxID=1821823 RepID=A0AAF0F773_9BASI|nr:hypothetical protein MPSI1_002633 [Malassezia psittaci]